MPHLARLEIHCLWTGADNIDTELEVICSLTCLTGLSVTVSETADVDMHEMPCLPQFVHLRELSLWHGLKGYSTCGWRGDLFFDFPDGISSMQHLSSIMMTDFEISLEQLWLGDAANAGSPSRP